MVLFYEQISYSRFRLTSLAERGFHGSVDQRDENVYGTFSAWMFLRRNKMGQVDSVLQRVIARAVSGAQAYGRDMNGQSQAAIAAVLVIRPDMTALEAARAVNRHGIC